MFCNKATRCCCLLMIWCDDDFFVMGIFFSTSFFFEVSFSRFLFLSTLFNPKTCFGYPIFAFFQMSSHLYHRLLNNRLKGFGASFLTNGLLTDCFTFFIMLTILVLVLYCLGANVTSGISWTVGNGVRWAIGNIMDSSMTEAMGENTNEDSMIGFSEMVE